MLHLTLRTASRPQPRAQVQRELAEAFAHHGRGQGRGTCDESRDTGARVFYAENLDGWSVEANGRSRQVRLAGGMLRAPERVSINSDATRVVGAFPRGPAKPSDPLAGSYGPTLVEVPVKGRWYEEPVRVMQRRGWVGLKVLAELPEMPAGLDIGPNNEVAVSAGNEVLRCTERGLEPLARFDARVEDLQYLSDGSLAVQVGNRFHHLESGEAFSFSDLFEPQRRAWIERELGLLAGRPDDEKEA